VWRASLICVTSLCDVHHWCVSHHCVTCIIDMCHINVWRASLICVTSLCDVHHWYVSHHSCDTHEWCVIHVTHIDDVCHMTHPCMSNASFTCAPWLIRLCDMPHSYESHVTSIPPKNGLIALWSATNRWYVVHVCDMPRVTCHIYIRHWFYTRLQLTLYVAAP